MKNIFFTILSTMLLIPIFVSAQAKRPTDNHGLATQADINTVIRDMINFFLTFLASLAVLMIIVSGIMYITSGGDSTRTETAKKMLTYSIAGLIVALVSYMIVYFISKAFGIV